MFLPRIENRAVFIGNIAITELVEAHGTPLYAYDAAVIRKRYADLVNTIAFRPLQIHYACKANTNLQVLQLLRQEGSRIETVSPGEVTAALEAGFKPAEIIFTCSNISKDELAWLIEQNISVNLDSLTQLKHFGELKPDADVAIRVNQGIGAGHHEHVITGGPDSKFGIDSAQLDEAKALAKKYQLRIVGLHQHIGSNVLDQGIFMLALEKLLETAHQFPDLAFLDFGGGFGVPYRESEDPLDMKELGHKITASFDAFTQTYGKKLEMRFEAGRYLVAESGILLVSVTDIKKTPYKTFVGVNSGFNHLIRPAMYDSYHHILNTSNLSGPEEVVTIAGNICESGDLFGRDRKLPKASEGDSLAILNTGAYGFTMSSTYNSRPLPREIVIDGDKVLKSECDQ